MTQTLPRVLAEIPSLGSVLERAATRYQSLSGVRGSVALSDAEASQIRRLGCKISRHNRLSLVELDRALRDSSVGAGLLDVLSVQGLAQPTRIEVLASEAARSSGFFDRLLAEAERWDSLDHARLWVMADLAYLTPLAVRGRARFVRGALQAVRALADLPRDEEPLAFFAARLFGDAHTLDPDRPAGRLLLRAIRVLHADALPGPGAALSPRALKERAYAAVGLLLDDVSSDVLVAGITAEEPWVRAAAASYQPVRLTLFSLVRTTGVAPASGRVVFVVENPMVFRMLHQRALTDGLRPALVCASGHPSLAAQRLIDILASGGRRIRYSGDFDVRGFQTALWFRDRHPEQVELWRMGSDDHAAAVTWAPAGQPAAADGLPDTINALLQRGVAHQETIVDLLWADVLELAG